MDKKSKQIKMSILPSIIILLIAGCGFIAGYYQNRYSEEAAIVNEQIYEEEEKALLMSEQIRYIYDNDNEQHKEMERLFGDIYTLMLEWIAIVDAPEINGSMELLANITHYEKIMSALYSAKIKAWDTRLFDMYRHFELMDEIEPFEVTFEAVDGVNMSIIRSDWEGSKNSLYENISIDTLFSRLIDAPSSTKEHLIDLINDDPAISSFFLMNMSIYYQILNQPLLTQRGIVGGLQRTAEGWMTQVNGISMGTSVTTVAAVLSTAMSNRMDQRKISRKILQVRVDLHKDDSILNGQRDLLSLPVLLIAALLSIAGLVMALLPTI